MTAEAAWLVAGLALAGLEMVVPGAFLLWIGLAALGAGGAALLFGLGWHAQFGLFAVLAIGLVVLAAPRLRRQSDVVNAPDVDVVGQLCRCIAFEGGEGRVSLRDGQWRARMAAGGTAVPGQMLRVTGLDGTVLLVAAA